MNFSKKIYLDSGEEEMEFMPIVPLGEVNIKDDEKSKLSEEIPILALRNTILYPNIVLPITVAREKSLEAVSFAKKNGGMIGGHRPKEFGKRRSRIRRPLSCWNRG